MDITKINFEPIILEARQSEAGFAKLLSIIQSYVINKSRAILSNYEDAQDIYQNISIRLYNNLNNIDPRGFMSYLKTSVTNACNDELRKRHKLTEDNEQINTFSIDAFEDYEIPDDDDNRIDLLDEYRNKIVFEVLDTLPDKQKEVIVLRYIDDLKIKDIANQLNINENTVKTRLYAAFENIKKEVLKIQDRDDIKLYSYSPLMFFLLLLRGMDSDTVNTLLLDNTLRYVTNNAGRGVVNTVVEQAVNQTASNVVKQAVTNTAISTASKASVSLATKALIGLLAVGAVGAGGYAVYNNAQKQKMIEAYNNDVIILNIELDDDSSMKIGETRSFTFDYTSNNGLEYEVEITGDQNEIIKVNDDNSITSLKAGDGVFGVTLHNKYTDKVKEKIKEVHVSADENNSTRIGNLLKKLGYSKSIIYNPIFAEELTSLYKFDWSIVDRTYYDWLEMPMCGSKWCETEEEISTVKDVYGSNLYYYQSEYNDDGLMSKIHMYYLGVWRGGALATVTKANADLTEITIELSGQLRTTVNLTYEKEYDKYSYISRTGNKEYVDLTSPFFTPYYTELFFENVNTMVVNIEYDENKNVIGGSWVDDWGNNRRTDLTYDNGKLVKVVTDYGYIDEWDIEYYDNGLINYVIEIIRMNNGSERVNSLEKMWYE